MKTRAAGIGACAVVGLLGWVPCHSAPALRTFYVQARAGYTTQSLGDVNRNIRVEQASLATAQLAAHQAGDGYSFRWEPYGDALDLGAEVGYRFSQRISKIGRAHV